MTIFGIIVLTSLFGWFLWNKIAGEKEAKKIDEDFNIDKFIEWTKENPEAFKEWYEREML